MKAPAQEKAIRCAIYTRKSTDEGLEQDFNSLDHQREAGEAYAKSQGWKCLEERYDDGGYSGGNTERPALQRLLADVEAKRVDRIVIYKIDRFSRSLIDFMRLIERLDAHGVSVVCVTQSFDTSTSMGRLILHVLLSFAQFEREMISERTRDKIAATRRKGKWSGGRALLGYDVVDTKLVINEDEAQQVRAIFALYLELESLLAVVTELRRRGWVTKRLVSRKGLSQGGVPFNKASLHKLLTHVAYTGQVRYKREVHPGEHAAIVDPDVWQRVQVMLAQHGQNGGRDVRNRFGALLKGILRCVPCDCAMSPTHSTKGTKRYRYYLCGTACKRGWQHCPSKSLPAHEIERFVVDQIRGMLQDRALVDESLAEAQRLADDRVSALSQEERSLRRELDRLNTDFARRLQQPRSESSAGLVDLQERMSTVEQRLRGVVREIEEHQAPPIDRDQAAQVLAQFDPLWETLTPREQTRVVQLLVQRVDYDGRDGKVRITFHSLGLAELAGQLTPQEVAA